MQERSIDDNQRRTSMIGSAAQKSFSPDPAAPAGAEPPCDCAGPPPPRFMLPPPPVDPAWATGDADVCDIVAPYQVCQALSGGAAGGADRGASSLSVIAVILAACGLLLIVLLIGLLFFCKYRRRVRGLLSGKDGTGKRSDTSRMLYDGLPVQTQVVPNNLRPNGQVPHIEMVAVKGQCHHLLPGGRPGVAGTLFVYPAPPSLTDDGSERASNMYEEIPFYGRQPPSVSCGSDSDDDVISRPSDDVILPSDEELRRQRPYYPFAGDEGSSGRRARTPPRSMARVPSQPRVQHRRQPSSDRRRRSPVSPGVLSAGRAQPALRDESLRRKDPYYYSDILARQQPHGDVTSPGSDVTEAYRRPYDDERRSSSRGPAYCQPDLGQGLSRSPSVLSRDRAGSPRGHVSPLANRMTLDPFVDMYGAERDLNRSRRHKLGSFRSPPGGGTPPRELGASDSGYMDVPDGVDQGAGPLSRYHRPPQWTH